MSGLRGRIAVFVGPSLPHEVRPRDPAFVWLPPARAGDAYALAGEGPRAAVLIDGLFDTTLAVRHKELLSLIATGAPVFGAASMGALRAAELHSFGMIGLGAIFRAFAAGRLTADDEVAVMHGPEGFGWIALTEPLVNVRATLVAAVRGKVLRAAEARVILQSARAIFYKERTWPAILSGGDDRGFKDWLAEGRVDLKRRDALECLNGALACSPGESGPRRAPPETLFSAVLADQVARGVRPD